MSDSVKRDDSAGDKDRRPAARRDGHGTDGRSTGGRSTDGRSTDGRSTGGRSSGQRGRRSLPNQERRQPVGAERRSLGGSGGRVSDGKPRHGPSLRHTDRSSDRSPPAGAGEQRRRLLARSLALSAWDLSRSQPQRATSSRRDVITLRTRQRLRAVYEAERHIPKEQRSFILISENSDDACLLIHGAMNGPADLRPLGEHLHRGGMSVCATLLPEYGHSGEEMPQVLWRASLQHARQEFRMLRQISRRVHVVGYGFGAVLALQLACREKVSSLALLAPALVPRVSLLQRFLLQIKLHRLPWITRRLGWNADMLEGMDQAKGLVGQLELPVYAAQCEDDERVSPVSLRFLHRKLRHRASRCQVFPTGGHAILNAHGKASLNQDVLHFFRDRR